MCKDNETRQEIQGYLDTIRFFNEGAEGYFFVWDVRKSLFYFAGEIYKKYPLPDKGDQGNTLQELMCIIDPRDLNAFQQALSPSMIENKDSSALEYRLVDKAGNREWVTITGKCKYDENGEPKFVLGRVSGSTLAAKVDMLTGLFNADRLMEDMSSCYSQNYSGHLMVLGIDNFKNINVKYGRSYGDYILKKVAERIEASIGDNMNVYRLDGDRYAVTIPDFSGGNVVEIYNKIQENVREYCTVSAGVMYCSPAKTIECSMVFQYAEAALDYAKKDGKSKLKFFSPQYYKEQFDTINLQDEFQSSVKNDFAGFHLFYQPLIDGNNSKIWGAEALLRYDSPVRGRMNPAEFIPLLERTELICPVGEWVLEKALEQCKIWRKVLPDFQINVNVSYIQMKRSGFTESVLRILNKSGLPGSALMLELTESVQLQDYSHFNKMFRRLKQFGIGIAIDDFGTGYSSLSYLKSIETDEIKIDRCFVTNIQNSAYNYRLLSNIIELAHSVGIKVCCEGVEMAEELSALKELEPDLLQGYLFAKPCSKDDFDKLYIRKSSNAYQVRT